MNLEWRCISGGGVEWGHYSYPADMIALHPLYCVDTEGHAHLHVHVRSANVITRLLSGSRQVTWLLCLSLCCSLISSAAYLNEWLSSMYDRLHVSVCVFVCVAALRNCRYTGAISLEHNWIYQPRRHVFIQLVIVCNVYLAHCSGLKWCPLYFSQIRLDVHLKCVSLGKENMHKQ